MPLYVFSCLSCGKQTEFCLGFYDIDHEKAKEEVDLKDKDCKCPNCSKTLFKKEIACNGRMPENWKWDRGMN